MVESVLNGLGGIGGNRERGKRGASGEKKVRDLGWNLVVRNLIVLPLELDHQVILAGY